MGGNNSHYIWLLKVRYCARGHCVVTEMLQTTIVYKHFKIYRFINPSLNTKHIITQRH